MLQWGHVFSDVEMPVASACHSIPLRLQWGHVFSDVEIRRACGRCQSPSRRFNGATSFQTWKFCIPALIASVSICFNGATSFQTWKWMTVPAPSVSTAQLQWGHVFSDVEMENASWISTGDLLLQWGHVFSDVEIN